MNDPELKTLKDLLLKWMDERADGGAYTLHLNTDAFTVQDVLDDIEDELLP